MLDFTMRPLYPARRLVVPEATGRVLEVGVGTGLNFGLYRDVTALEGIDPDPFMLERARARAAAARRSPGGASDRRPSPSVAAWRGDRRGHERADGSHDRRRGGRAPRAAPHGDRSREGASGTDRARESGRQRLRDRDGV